jgi:hypothetical protein
MKITITTDQSVVVDQIDLDGWDWRRPIGWAVLAGRIKMALECEDEICNWCGSGTNTLLDTGAEKICQDCLDNRR